MAIGTSKIFGIDLEPNFNLPYIADGMSDFWKRWHISLSSWLRDYLYFLLGGSRKGESRVCVNSNDEQRVMTWSRLDIYIVGILSRGDELS